MNHGQDLQNNQTEYIDDHNNKRNKKSNTLDDTSGTKPNSGSRGWGSHKLTHQQNSLGESYSQDNNY